RFYVVNNQAMRPDVFSRTIRRTLMTRPGPEFFFMNRECQKGLSVDLGRDFSLNRIVPLPVGSRAEITYRPVSPRRLLSIGRIDPVMKTYNWNLIPRLAELRKYRVFEWHIYGDGELHEVESLIECIEEHDAQGFIFY